MTKELALIWIHKQMRANRLAATVYDGVQRCVVKENEVHVYKGIPTLAQALNVPCMVTTVDDSPYPVRLSFEYEGCKFFQMEETLDGVEFPDAKGL